MIQKSSDDNDETRQDDEPKHSGTLKVDATCADVEVRHPTDIDLLHDGKVA